MAMSKEEARQALVRLVDKYQSLTPSAIRKYTEADTRRIFIMPLFHALCWDVYSREEVAEEVKAATGRVDYVFKLHGVSQFYLEAKALRADLTKPEYIKQAITYAYNKGITWAVLTDFERLQVYNAQTGRRCLNLSYDNYLKNFDDLWLLSRESLENNALNEWAEKYGALPPRLGIEQRLFNQLRHWREELFTQLYHYNPNLSFNQIDEVIQRLFNRLIFIRTCEDRRIEDRVLLGAVHEWRSSGRREELIEALRSIFRDFDGYYDSDLFALHLVDQVFIESATIENIINGLYEIPGGMASYDFSLIDADVLGAVYEQYLGHVATVAKQRAKEAQARMDLGFPSEPTFELTAKKERRKEHGIYYTPRFVTDYIVRETVGHFLKERSHNEILNIKILDPACGSGSFLIRAYDELLNYHAYRSGKSVTELDQYERLPILIKNVFGVDLDMQAVEIARLNLLLRSLAKRETLPSLADNIREGNSLISGTEEELKKYFGDKWQEKKPFNWEIEFKDIMASGGFDVVIGNPPYGDLLSEQEKNFLLETGFTSGGKTNDVFRFLVERGLKLLKENGLLGMILPNSYLTGIKYESFRNCVLQNAAIMALIDFGVIKVFEQGVFNSILILRKTIDERTRNNNEVTLLSPGIHENHDISSFQKQITKQSKLINSDWVLTGQLLARVMSSSDYGRLAEFCDSKDAGINYQRTGVGWMSRAESRLRQDILYDGSRQHELDIAYLKGGDVDRYQIRGDHLYKRWLRHNYEDFIKENETVAFNKSFFQAPVKIITRQTGDSIIGTLDTEQWYTGRSLHCTIPKHSCQLSLKYILALLNSKLMTHFYQQMSPERGRAQAQVKLNKIRKLPIHRIDFDNPAERKLHDDLVTLVDKMLELNKHLAPISNTPCNERDELIREINHTDSEIDNLVYDLYGLIEEERKIVKES
jgi:type I restriction-modification system DNA methylase subunit